MEVSRNIISLVFLFGLITALPVKEVSYDGDNTADILRRAKASELSKNKNDNTVSTKTETSFLNLEDNLFGGNILKQANLGRNGVTNKSMIWPNGTIPYRIEGLFYPRNRVMIMKALNTIQFWTCIRFVPHNGEKDFIVLKHEVGTGCYSDLGRQGGRQVVYLERGYCMSFVGYPIHEILHAIGIIHEQSRPDRDEYVKIYDRNIQYGYENNFEKYAEGETEDFGVPYDYNSVMHYALTEASARGLQTIEPKLADGWNSYMGQRGALSVRDVIKIRNMYNCYYKINYSERSSRVLPDIKNKTSVSKAELWNTYFRDFKYTHS